MALQCGKAFRITVPDERLNKLAEIEHYIWKILLRKIPYDKEGDRYTADALSDAPLQSEI